MNDRDELAGLLVDEYTEHYDRFIHNDNHVRVAEAILASDWLAKVRAEAEVGILSDVIVSLNNDPSVSLYAPVLQALEGTVAHIRREVGL